MTPNNKILSKTRLKRLRAQGYYGESNQQLTEMAFGIRFAYRLCTSIIIVAILTQSLELFSAMLLIAIFGVILPKHPFDYLYNHTLSKWMSRPQLPKRSIQLKFACTIASLWLTSVVYFMSIGSTTTALVLASTLAIIASFPSTIDFCVPSAIFNAIVKLQRNKAKI